MSHVAQSDFGLGLYAVKMKQPVNSLVIVSAEAEVALLLLKLSLLLLTCLCIDVKKASCYHSKEFCVPTSSCNNKPEPL